MTESYVARPTVPPPRARGLILSRTSLLPYMTPIPEGPSILWIDMQYTSAPIFSRSTGMCGAAWAPSMTTVAP